MAMSLWPRLFGPPCIVQCWSTVRLNDDDILASTVVDVARFNPHSAADAARRRHQTRRLSPVRTRHSPAIVLRIVGVHVFEIHRQVVRHLAPVFTLSTGRRVLRGSRISASDRVRQALLFRVCANTSTRTSTFATDLIWRFNVFLTHFTRVP